jgi:hypothetical protein
MFKDEKRIYFEWLVARRMAYPTLGEEDRSPVITVDDIIAWAERELASTSVAGPNATTDA